MPKLLLQPERKPLAVGISGRTTFLLCQELGEKERLVISTSKEGKKFSDKVAPVLLKYKTGKRENLSKCSEFKISSAGKSLAMTYLLKKSNGPVLVYATARSPKTWTVQGTISTNAPGVFVPKASKKSSEAVYFGKDTLWAATSSGKRWNIRDEQKRPHWRFFDGLPFQIAGAVSSKEGTFVFCASSLTEEILNDVNRGTVVGEVEMCRLSVALFKSEAPAELAWHTELPFMDLPLGKKDSLKTLGIVEVTLKREKILRLYVSIDGAIHFFEFPLVALSKRERYLPMLLAKASHNPIIQPGRELWEHHSAFNPAAIRVGETVHILYRAIGPDGISRLGYASSPDGLNVAGFMKFPAFALEKPESKTNKTKRYNPVMYPSGGSWGGCEDPRMVQIEDKVYMTFNMFDGWDRLRVAVVWISLEDFLEKKFWKWSKPVLLSPEGQVHKNWILFPEKIKGKFALLHNLHDDDLERVRIEYLDDVEKYQAPPALTSPDPNAIADRPVSWHKRMRSAGPPPLKTSKGWLLFYHATDRYEPKRYKLGVMLLDLNDPTKILHRASAAILNPDEYYENNGKPGIVYACGAVEIGESIYIYYGGADRVACVATVKTEELLNHIIKDEDTRFKIVRVTT